MRVSVWGLSLKPACLVAWLLTLDAASCSILEVSGCVLRGDSGREGHQWVCNIVPLVVGFLSFVGRLA